MKLEHSLTPYTKINSKWIKDLDIRPDTIKLLEENIGHLHIHAISIKLPMAFFIKLEQNILKCYPAPRIRKIKPKINKRDLIKLKSF